MTGETFYRICDVAEEIEDNITNNYYPKVAEIDQNIANYGLEKQIITLAYFASNPFRRMNIALADEEDYIATVDYCKKKLTEIPLDEEL